MILKLFDKTNALKMEISPSESSSQVKAIQSDNILSLTSKTYECVGVDVNDYIDFCDERFWAIEQYVPKQISTVEWEYTLKLYGIESMIKRFLILKLVNGADEAEFSLTATAYDHVALIVENINAGMGSGDWKVGEVVGSEYITIDYSGTYCDQGLSMIAEKVNGEFWIEGTTVNVGRCEHGENITLGYDNGLTTLYSDTAKNVKFFTRLYPIGSTRNISYEDYGSSRLQLPDGQKYVDKDVDKFGVVHHYEKDAFSHIYPHRIGEVSGVRHKEVTGDDGEPYLIYYFKDGAMNFDPNDYELPGLVKQVSFQSGALNGRDFQVNYNSADKEFEVITQWPYDNDIQLPNEQLPVAIGDEYILWNIKMPAEYYPLAEAEFLQAVEQYMAESRSDVSVYKAHTDYIDIAERDINLTIGQRVRLVNSHYFQEGYRDSRITKITRKVLRPTEMDIEISDVLSIGSFERVDNEIASVKSYVQSASSGFPQIIKSTDNTQPTDTTVYSTRASHKQHLSKLNEDTAHAKITFEAGLVASEMKTPSYTPGALGSGGAFTEDPATGESTLIVHNVVAKNGITAPVFTVRTMTATGGIEVTSSAFAKLTRVVNGGTYWQCFYEAEGQFWEGLDQARLQGDFGRFLWGLVTSVSTSGGASSEGGVKKEYSFNISKTTIASGTNTEPQEGDVLVLYGNRSTDPAKNYRQTLMIKSCGVDNPDEGYYPYEAKWVEIDSFSLPLEKRRKWDGKTYDIIVDSFSIRNSGGEIVRQPVDRGAFVSGTTYYDYERASLNGSLWQCVVESTTQEPREGASDWVAVTEGAGSVQVGTVNLLDNYNFAKNDLSGWSGVNYTSLSIVNQVLEVRILTASSATRVEYTTPTLSAGTYTIVFDADLNQINPAFEGFVYNDGSTGAASLVQIDRTSYAADTGHRGLYSATFTTTKLAAVKVRFYLKNPYTANVSYIYAVSLSQGNVVAILGESEADRLARLKAIEEAADDAQKDIDAMNSDTIFDVTEKHSIRDNWYQIQGTANTTGNAVAGGSYKVAIDQPNGNAEPADVTAAKTALTTAYNALKSKLNALALYTDTNTSDFNRNELSGLFAAYHNAEQEVYKVISKGNQGQKGEDGESGVGVSKTDVEYSISSSATVAPTTGWQTTAPAWQDGKYIWQRVVTTYTNGTSKTSTAVNLTGSKGATGAAGGSVTILSTSVTYAKSTSGTTPPTSGWSSSVPTVPQGEFLWTKTFVDYSSGTDTTSYSVTREGVDGAKGDTGAAGTSVTITSTSITYTAHTSATNAPSSGWSESIPTVPQGQFLWTRTQVNYSDGNNTTSYAVSRQGQDGAVGTAGKGISAITNYYLASASASGVTTSTAGWTTGVQNPSEAKKYLWNYEKVTFTDNTTSSTTPSIIGNYASDGQTGATGDTGADGKGISSIVEYYAINNSTTAPTSGFSTLVQTPTASNRYLWNYEVINYTTGSPYTSAKRIIGVYGEKGATGDTGDTGNGISSVVEEYYLSDSKTTQSGGSWSTAMPTWSSGKYVWIRSKVTYTDTTVAYVGLYCDSSWEAVNEVQVGVVNLLDNYNFAKNNLSGWSGVNYTSLSIVNQVLEVRILTASSATRFEYITPVLSAGTYTIVFDADLNQINPAFEGFVYNDGSTGAASLVEIDRTSYATDTGQRGLYSATFTTIKTAAVKVRFYLKNPYTANVSYIYAVSLSQGNVVAILGESTQDLLNTSLTQGANLWLKGGDASQEAIERALSGEGAPFEIVDDVVVMTAAFIRGLVSQSAFIEYLVARRYVSADGRVEIDEGGRMRLQDASQITRVLMQAANITPLSEITGSGGSGTTSAITRSLDTGRTVLASLNISKANATVSFTGSITATAQVFSEGDTSSVTSTLVLEDASGNIVGTVDGASAYTNDPTQTVTVTRTLERKFTVGAAGAYYLVANTTRSSTGEGIAVNTSGVNNLVFTWSFVAAISRSEIGMNGMLSAWNSSNLWHLAWDALTQKLTETFKGVSNRPGVLCSGSVSGHYANKIGTIYSPTRAAGVERYLGRTGQFLITHNIGHTDYHVGGIVKYANVAASLMEIQKNTNSVVVGVLDVQSAFRNLDFNFMICGNN